MGISRSDIERIDQMFKPIDAFVFGCGFKEFPNVAYMETFGIANSLVSTVWSSNVATGTDGHHVYMWVEKDAQGYVINERIINFRLVFNDDLAYVFGEDDTCTIDESV